MILEPFFGIKPWAIVFTFLVLKHNYSTNYCTQYKCIIFPLGLVAVESDGVLELMADEFPDKYKVLY